MVNTRKEFPRGILDQVISCGIRRRPSSGRAPGPGLKLGEMDIASFKPQALTKLVNACIDQSEPQAPSSKLQASSLT